MAMADVLKVVNAADMKKAIDAFAVPESFNHDKFFEMMGMKKMAPKEVNMLFNWLDVNQDGFIDADEFQFLFIRFVPEARKLSVREAERLVILGDKNGDGKLDIDEFADMVSLSERI